MLRRGVGLTTGLRGVNVESAILVDSSEVYESVKRAAGASLSEFSGVPGVSVATGGGLLQKPVLVKVPPYPSIVYEVVHELVVFGARKIVSVSRGYSLRKSVPSESLILPSAAVSMDMVSQAIVRRGLPLLVSKTLYNILTERIIRKGGAGFSSYYRGKVVVTVDSPRLAAAYLRGEVESFGRYKDVVAMDTVTAPLYALQYIYPSLETASLVYIIGSIDKALDLVEEDIERYQAHQYKLRRMLTLLVLSIIETLGEQSGSRG
jgi:hypothetical protein